MRPTLAPSIPPEAHAARLLDRRDSQVPTLEPPEPARQAVAPLREWAGESQRPTATDGSSLEFQAALDFVDGHARESLSPSELAPDFSKSLPSERPGGARDTSISDLYAVGDFSGALSEAERRLELDPDDLEALRYVDECRRTLIRMYSARLAPMDRPVRLAVPMQDIRWLTLDHRAGFLISRVDGVCSVEDLLDISGMPRLDALRILAELVTRGVVALD